MLLAGKTQLRMHAHVRILAIRSGDEIRRDLEGITGEIVEPVPALDNGDAIAGIILDHQFRDLFGMRKVNLLEGDEVEALDE